MALEAYLLLVQEALACPADPHWPAPPTRAGLPRRSALACLAILRWPAYQPALVCPAGPRWPAPLTRADPPNRGYLPPAFACLLLCLIVAATRKVQGVCIMRLYVRMV